jgi:hypothetical protein
LKQSGKRTELFSGRDSFDDPMYLSEENAEIALQMCRDVSMKSLRNFCSTYSDTIRIFRFAQELITMFGYSAENQAVGITGKLAMNSSV